MLDLHSTTCMQVACDSFRQKLCSVKSAYTEWFRSNLNSSFALDYSYEKIIYF